MDLYFITSEIYASYKVKLLEPLLFQLQGRLGRTTQDIGIYAGQSIYNSRSIFASLSWAL